MKTCDNLVMTSPKWEIIVYKYQINTTQSLKYKISTSLFIYCCTSSLASWMLYYLVQLDVQWIWCSGVPSALSNAGTKTENIWQRIYAYLNRWSICVGLVTWITWERPVAFIWPHFKPTGKKTLSVPHSPSEIYLLHTSLPLGISVTLRGGGGGYGYFLEPHNIQNKSSGKHFSTRKIFIFVNSLSWVSINWLLNYPGLFTTRRPDMILQSNRKSALIFIGQRSMSKNLVTIVIFKLDMVMVSRYLSIDHDMDVQSQSPRML